MLEKRTNLCAITKNKGTRRYELRLAEYSTPADIGYGFSLRLPPEMHKIDELLTISQWHKFTDMVKIGTSRMPFSV